MKQLIWNTHKNFQSFWGKYHYNASRSWIFCLLKKVKYEILEDLKHIKYSIRPKKLLQKPALCKKCGFKFKERSKPRDEFSQVRC